MSLVKVGQCYKWLERSWMLSNEDAMIWDNNGINKDNIFLLLNYSSIIRRVGNIDLVSHEFKIFFENQIWMLNIFLHLGEEALLKEYFELLC